MWTVQVATGQDKNTNVRTHNFATKRETLEFIRSIPINFVGRINHTYTIYPRR
jgi:hypothetical protein